MDASHPEQGSGAPRTPVLFSLLWETLANLIGTPATATLLRRSLKRAVSRRPGLGGVNITRAEHDYVFTLPPSWEAPSDDALEDLRALFAEVCALSQQLTGSVIVRRLTAIPELAPLRSAPQEDTT